MSRDRYGPAIDTDWFPNTWVSGFWSSSPDAYGSYDAWYVNFGYDYKFYAVYVRLVRGRK